MEREKYGQAPDKGQVYVQSQKFDVLRKELKKGFSNF